MKTSVLDTLKTKTERAVNAAVNAMDKQDCSEAEFANTNLKLLDEYEYYTRKTKSITNKILDAFQIVIDQIGNLSELQRNFHSQRDVLPVQKDETTLQINFLLFTQGNFTALKEEMSKCVVKQAEQLLKEIGDVKQNFTKNMRKPVDTLESMVVMRYQLSRLFNSRTFIMQTQPYKIYQMFNNNINSFYATNQNLNGFIDNIETNEAVIPTIQMKCVPYVGKTLGEILDLERRKRNEIPKVIEEMISLIENKFIERQGLFRTAASLKQVSELYHRLSVSNLNEFPCETIANTLKRFTRELPGMMFCNSLARDMLSVYKKSTERMERIDELAHLFSTQRWIPEEKITFFKALCLMCHHVAQNSEKNLMGEKNLAVCWTPTLFSVASDDIGEYLEMMTFIITEADTIFADTRFNYSKNVTTTVRGRNLNTTQPEMLCTVPTSMIPKVPSQQEKIPKMTSEGASPIFSPSSIPALSPRNNLDPVNRYAIKPQRPLTMLPPSAPPPKAPKYKPQQRDDLNSGFLLEDL
ncbi:hypothetical protein EIN_059970 [Entamoeba invadens IP1]|uniref:hypothetical protein n=1 Tax=Entamoeba invadens IP1 TaxID=370355 RepID=UPI0002C3DFE3|nr:hypothetical protein EIN_059970 [Entamoeba invadens IP1]ELP93492.1 hypothetical protein EIN_059970 [Entamoeba invadens IP1]|eukprot:XP_004260263.1 hypothetical protein EIN_059970 [Entamoeba invadens IP1]